MNKKELEEICYWKQEARIKHDDRCDCCDGSVEDALDIACKKYIRSYREKKE